MVRFTDPPKWIQAPDAYFVLPDLQFLQTQADHCRPHQGGDNKRGHSRQNAAKRDVLKYSKSVIQKQQLLCQPCQHAVAPNGWVKAYETVQPYTSRSLNQNRAIRGKLRKISDEVIDGINMKRDSLSRISNTLRGRAHSNHLIYRRQIGRCRPRCETVLIDRLSSSMSPNTAIRGDGDLASHSMEAMTLQIAL